LCGQDFRAWAIFAERTEKGERIIDCFIAETITDLHRRSVLLRGFHEAVLHNCTTIVAPARRLKNSNRVQAALT
jgi:hypothetical protein